MTEMLFRKKYTKRRLSIYIYCFKDTRDRPNEKETKEIEGLINDMLIGKGWKKE